MMSSPEPSAHGPQRLDAAEAASLFMRHHAQLQRFLLGVLRDADLAGEAMQAAFAKMVELGHTARSETLKGWLFRVAFNEAMAIRRRQALHLRTTAELVARQPQPELTPDQHALRSETIEQVRRALAELPPEQSQVVRMRIYEHKKFIEIAAEMDLPLGTVLTRMQLALKKLRKALADSQDDR